jgi:hypothetical protein
MVFPFLVAEFSLLSQDVIIPRPLVQYLLLSASARLRSTVSSLVHQGTLLPLATRSPALDALKAALQVSVTMEVNYGTSLSMSVNCLTISPSSSSHCVRSLVLFTQLKLDSMFVTSLFSNLPQSSAFIR